MLAPESHLDAALILFVLCVAIIDWRTHRIPNLLCAAGALIGFGSQLWMHGEDGLWSALGGAAAGFSMFLPFYALRAFGAGDVKAMAIVGIFLGMRGAMIAVGMTLIAGALLGVASMASARGTAAATPTESQRFPYGTAIACGAAAALLIVSH
jgi:prepilin peptidase CpaA